MQVTPVPNFHVYSTPSTTIFLQPAMGYLQLSLKSFSAFLVSLGIRPHFYSGYGADDVYCWMTVTVAIVVDVALTALGFLLLLAH